MKIITDDGCRRKAPDYRGNTGRGREPFGHARRNGIAPHLLYRRRMREGGSVAGSEDDDGTSLRGTVETGEVLTDGSNADDDGTTPDIIAGAYTNSGKGTEATQLFNIDGASGWLVLQDPPNDGKLNPVGAIGATPTGAGFAIASNGNGANAARLVIDGGFHSVDLATGTATEVARIAGAILPDIAILPAI